MGMLWRVRNPVKLLGPGSEPRPRGPSRARVLTLRVRKTQWNTSCLILFGIWFHGHPKSGPFSIHFHDDFRECKSCVPLFSMFHGFLAMLKDVERVGFSALVANKKQILLCQTTQLQTPHDSELCSSLDRSRSCRCGSLCQSS